MNQNDANHSCAKRALVAGLILIIAAISGCASKKTGEPVQLSSSAQEKSISGRRSVDQRDYLEPINRPIFKVNEVLDGLLLKPVVHIYLGVMPEFGQKIVRNVLTNMSSPVVFFNSVLQADTNNAGKTLGRFVINSTLGIAGAFDVASEFGIQKEHKKDFGQTLGVYGVDSGSYMVLPLLGPSDVRDTLGLVADVFSDPFTYILTENESLVRAGVAGIVRRGDYMKITDRVYRDSLDPYAGIRSIYLQNRDKVVRDYLGNDTDAVKYPGAEKKSGK